MEWTKLKESKYDCCANSFNPNTSLINFPRPADLTDTLNSICCEEISGNKKINSKENNTKKNFFNNYHFGQFTTDKIAYSIKGIAFKNNNEDYYIYNLDGTTTNVSNYIIEMSIFAMPAAIKDLKIGDIIRHDVPDVNENYVIIKEIKKNAIVAISPFRNEIINIVPETSIFGFSFYTKIISPMEIFKDESNEPNEDNPFGNLLPFILFSNNNNENNNNLILFTMLNRDNKIDMEKYLPFILMNR